MGITAIYPGPQSLVNATERLWRTVKYEEVYIHEYATPREARQGLTRYFQFYNQERPHQALAYLTPAEIYYATQP